MSLNNLIITDRCATQTPTVDRKDKLITWSDLSEFLPSSERFWRRDDHTRLLASFMREILEQRCHFQTTGNFSEKDFGAEMTVLDFCQVSSERFWEQRQLH